ncbi:MAG: hypothetical protein ACRC50_03415 [Gaiella sp.]
MSPLVLLSTLVATATVVRAVLALPLGVPRYLPDEYLYPLLARSLAAGEGIAVLGVPASFPALLEPALTAPLWLLTSDTTSAIALTQLFHAALASCAAFPVYGLARTVRLSERTALVCGGLTLLVPASFYVSFLTADALGFLLALTAVALAVRAVSTPTAGAELAALSAVGLATFARLQYAVVWLGFVAAVITAERFDARRVRRRVPCTSIALALAAVAAPIVGARAVGRYEVVTEFTLSGSAVRWAWVGGLLLAGAAAGVAIAPGAFAWAIHGVIRPTSRERGALAAVFLTTTAVTLAVASVLTVETASDRFLERYLIVVAPLAAVGFACWLDERRPARWLVAGVACLLLLGAMRLPLSEFTFFVGLSDSPTIFAVATLQRHTDAATASLVAAGVLSLGALLAVLLAVAPRTPAAVAFGVAMVSFCAIGAGAHVGDRHAARMITGHATDGSLSWVDDAASGPVLLLQTPGSSQYDSMTIAATNRSLSRGAYVGADATVARFEGVVDAATIDRRGTIRVEGTPVRQPVLAAIGGTAVAFSGAHVTYDRAFVLARPAQALHIALLAEGVRGDGRLATRGAITLYPRAEGDCSRVDLRLSVPPQVPPTTLQFVETGTAPRTVVVGAGPDTRLSWVGRAGAPRRIEYRTLLLGTRPPTPEVATVADVGWSLTPIPCN